MRAYQSNDLEVLSDLLEEKILQGSLFHRRYLIVPSNFLKDWLFERWAQKNRHVMAVETFSMQEGTSHLLKKMRNQEICFPSIMELELLIREEILLSCQSEDPIFNPLKKFLLDNEKQKLGFLSSKLSKLFSLYGQYGLDFIVKPGEPKDWQEKIYRQIFARKKLHIPIQELTKSVGKLDSCDIFLFCFSFLPPAYFDFFYRLSGQVQVLNFVLSPCSKYWEDLSTHFEERKLRKQYEEVEWIDSFFQTNPVLANFGVIGKHYQRTMSGYDLEICEHYREKEGKSFLQEVQNDILYLKKTEKKTCPSIQVQPVMGTKFDEIRSLKKNLSLYFSQGYRPEDVLILARDINEYLPFIFTEQTLDYKVSDICLLHQSFLARAILQILSLSYEKWTLKDLYQLFENPLLQRKFSFSQEDADLFYQILKRSKLKLGYDEEHMATFFEKKIKEHTWKDILQRLVLSLAVFLKDGQDFDYPHPIEILDISDADMLNTFIDIIERLKKQTETFQSQPIKSWAMILEDLVDIYFPSELGSSVEQNSMQVLQGVVEKFKQISCKIDVEVDQIYSILKREFQRKTLVKHMHLLDVVHFANLDEGNIKPAKIIYILGMNQETLDQESSLNLLKKSKQFYPTNSAKQKYLLLEHLILAKEKIVFSYPIRAHNATQELTSSLWLKELTSYLGDFFECSEKKELSLHVSRPFTTFSYPATSVQNATSTTISISSLKRLVKNPFDFYLKQKWKMDFEIGDPNELSISGLERYQMLSSCLEKDPKQVIDQFDKLAQLPQGVFKQITEHEIMMSAESYTYFVKDEKVYQFQFQKECKEPYLNRNIYIFPAIEVLLGETTFHIIGTLFHITKKGMILFKEDTLKERIYAYPSYLMYLKAIQILETFEPNLLFLKSQKIKSILLEDLDSFLKDYIRYYLVASHTLSPFMDFAISSLLKGDYKRFEKSYRQALYEQKNWLMSRMDLSNLQRIFNSWSLYLKEVFDPIL